MCYTIKQRKKIRNKKFLCACAGTAGGILMGKKIRNKKFLWGFVAGTVYFGILFAVSLIIKGGAGIEPVKMITTWVLCACAGTAGGMIS